MKNLYKIATPEEEELYMIALNEIAAVYKGKGFNKWSTKSY